MKSNMKIGYFISHFLYKNRLNEAEYHKEYAHGGTEVAAYNLAVQMRNRGHHINVFTTAIDRRNSVEQDNSMTIYRYGTNFRIASANFSLGLLNGPQKTDLDIVHAHYNMPYADYSAMKYSTKKNVPLVLTYHADAPETGGSSLRNRLQAFYNRHILPQVLNHAYIIITTSNAYIDQSKFLANYRQKIKVVPNGINLDEFQIKISKEECREKLDLDGDKIIILFFGNLVQYKGLDVLLRAFTNIKDKYPDGQLLFVGRGPMRHELIRMSKNLGVEGDIIFTGYVEEKLKYLYYKAADIFCLPSVNLTEAFGIVNLEAMACGLPIIASNLGGISDLVKENENGLLFEPGNVKEISNKLEYLLDNKNLRIKMGKMSKKLAADYSWTNIASKTELIYNNLLS